MQQQAASVMVEFNRWKDGVFARQWFGLWHQNALAN
jgi:hypothetical protein